METMGLVIAFVLCIAFTLALLFGPWILMFFGVIGPIAMLVIEALISVGMWIFPGIFRRSLRGIFNWCSRIFKIGYQL